MAKLIWDRCPKHRMKMLREYDKELRPFYYCPICGFYRYYEGEEGYNNKLILNNIDNKDINNLLCPQCKANNLTTFEQNGWYCSRCKYRI